MHNRGIEFLPNYVFYNTHKNTTIAAATKPVIWSRRPLFFQNEVFNCSTILTIVLTVHKECIPRGTFVNF